MKRIQLGRGVIVLLAVIPTVASAQQAGIPFWFGHYVALRNKVVQEELQLTDEQKERVSELDKEVRNALQGLQDLSREDRRKKWREVLGKFRASFKKTLTDQQQKRLNQIAFQRAGLIHGVLHARLKLTEKQREKIGEISDEVRKASRELSRQESGRERLETMRQDAEAKVKAMLTEEQKKQWTDFIGEPFDVSKISPRLR
jgi:Spy/CpxP family protein refolding chaperone